MLAGKSTRLANWVRSQQSASPITTPKKQRIEPAGPVLGGSAHLFQFLTADKHKEIPRCMLQQSILELEGLQMSSILQMQVLVQRDSARDQI